MLARWTLWSSIIQAWKVTHGYFRHILPLKLSCRFQAILNRSFCAVMSASGAGLTAVFPAAVTCPVSDSTLRISQSSSFLYSDEIRIGSHKFLSTCPVPCLTLSWVPLGLIFKNVLWFICSRRQFSLSIRLLVLVTWLLLSPKDCISNSLLWQGVATS